MHRLMESLASPWQQNSQFTVTEELHFWCSLFSTAKTLGGPTSSASDRREKSDGEKEGFPRRREPVQRDHPDMSESCPADVQQQQQQHLLLLMGKTKPRNQWANRTSHLARAGISSSQLNHIFKKKKQEKKEGLSGKRNEKHTELGEKELLRWHKS